MKMKEWKALGLILLAVALWGCQSGNESAATDDGRMHRRRPYPKMCPIQRSPPPHNPAIKSRPVRLNRRKGGFESAARSTDKAPIAPSRRVNRASRGQ